MEWRKTDPREHFNKRGRIIIVYSDGASHGLVETKHNYYIETDHKFKRYAFIDADAPWPDGWLWTVAPETP